MSDWQPGDLALCVRNPIRPSHPTRSGAVYTVNGVHLTQWGLALSFDEVPEEGPDWLFHTASRFRKILPHTPDAEDAETIRLLTGKPVRERVS